MSNSFKFNVNALPFIPGGINDENTNLYQGCKCHPENRMSIQNYYTTCHHRGESLNREVLQQHHIFTSITNLSNREIVCGICGKIHLNLVIG